MRMILARVSFHVGINPYKKEMVPSFHSTYSDFIKKHKASKINVIYLHRDPRDCVVSRYFEITRRRRDPPKSKDPKKVYNNTLSECIRRADQHGIVFIIDYMNEWIRNLSTFKSSLVISYEKLHSEPISVIRSVLDFLSVNCSTEQLKEAIEYSSFKNMRQIEKTGTGNLLQKYHGTFGKRHKESDPESFRIRKGRIGGFVDYLSDEDIRFSNEAMKCLDDSFGY